MVKAKAGKGGGPAPIRLVEERAAKVAAELSLEMVEVTLQKESRGKCLCVYADKEGGLSLDDCERYHRALQPLLEDIDYDIMEVSSPGVDRPVKTRRDFEKHRDELVEVRLFAPLEGSKVHRGLLTAMDDQSVTILQEGAGERAFQRKAVALIKPVIQFEDGGQPVEDELSEDDFKQQE